MKQKIIIWNEKIFELKWFNDYEFSNSNSCPTMKNGFAVKIYADDSNYNSTPRAVTHWHANYLR